jgi:hypothetical protein
MRDAVIAPARIGDHQGFARSFHGALNALHDEQIR